MIAFAQASLDHNPPVYTACIARMTSMCHHTQLFSVEMGVSLTFCLGWPPILILLVSTCWDTGMSHLTCPSVEFLSMRITCCLCWRDGPLKSFYQEPQHTYQPKPHFLSVSWVGDSFFHRENIDSRSKLQEDMPIVTSSQNNVFPRKSQKQNTNFLITSHENW
jgi:hypothetical protein